MSASESLSRTLRLQLVDARDKAQRALEKYEEADEPSDRVEKRTRRRDKCVRVGVDLSCRRGVYLR